MSNTYVIQNISWKRTTNHANREVWEGYWNSLPVYALEFYRNSDLFKNTSKVIVYSLFPYGDESSRNSASFAGRQFPFITILEIPNHVELSGIKEICYNDLYKWIGPESPDRHKDSQAWRI